MLKGSDIEDGLHVLAPAVLEDMLAADEDAVADSSLDFAWQATALCPMHQPWVAVTPPSRRAAPVAPPPPPPPPSAPAAPAAPAAAPPPAAPAAVPPPRAHCVGCDKEVPVRNKMRIARKLVRLPADRAAPLAMRITCSRCYRCVQVARIEYRMGAALPAILRTIEASAAWKAAGATWVLDPIGCVGCARPIERDVRYIPTHLVTLIEDNDSVPASALRVCEGCRVFVLRHFGFSSSVNTHHTKCSEAAEQLRMTTHCVKRLVRFYDSPAWRMMGVRWCCLQ